MEYFFAFVFLILFGLASGGFTGVALARLGRRGRNTPKTLALRPADLVAAPLLVFLSLFGLGMWWPSEAEPAMVYDSLLAVVVFLVPILMLRMFLGPTFWFEKGVVRKRLGWATRAWLVGIPGLLAMAAATQLLIVPFLPHDAPTALDGLDDHGPGTIALMALFACIVQPILEEMLFRGFLFRGLCGPRIGLSPTRALFVSSLLFGLAHTPDMWLIGMYLGGMLAWLDWRSGDLRLPMLAHCAHNTFFFVVALN